VIAQGKGRGASSENGLQGRRGREPRDGLLTAAAPI